MSIVHITSKCTHQGCDLTVTNQIDPTTSRIVCPVGHPVSGKIATVEDLVNFLKQVRPDVDLSGLAVGAARTCDSCQAHLKKGDVFYECQDCGSPGFDICQKCADNPPKTLIEGDLQHTVLHRTLRKVH